MYRTRQEYGTTHPKKLAIRQHALLQASVQKVHMVLHQLIDCPIQTGGAVILGLQSRHERQPIRLDDLCSAKVEQLLDEDQHARSEGPDTSFPELKLWT